MLPINFHKTFIPERRLIAALLEYANLCKEGSLKEISYETGIPMGESNGKMPAILDYALGMGLIKLSNGEKDRVKKPRLTDFGRVVFDEDRELGEEVVQWLVHMNLCRPDIGASAWNQVFAKGREVLGSSFSKGQLEEYLVSRFGAGRSRTGPMVAAYQDDAALRRARVITVEGERITRNRAPIRDIYAIAYSALILSWMEVFFPNQGQVTFKDFNDKTGWFEMCLWGQSDLERLATILERKGYVAIDRQMRPWIFEKRAQAGEVWQHIFNDMA